MNPEAEARGRAKAAEAMSLQEPPKPQPVRFGTEDLFRWKGRGLAIELGTRAYGELQLQEQIGYPPALLDLQEDGNGS